MVKTVLTVDDTVSIQQLVAFTLKIAGYGVIGAAYGIEAIGIAHMKTMRLVLTDQNMQRLSGLALKKFTHLASLIIASRF